MNTTKAYALNVETDVLDALGLTMAEIEQYGLRLFIDRCTDRGYSVTVSTKRSLEKTGRFSITMDPPAHAPIG